VINKAKQKTNITILEKKKQQPEKKKKIKKRKNFENISNKFYYKMMTTEIATNIDPNTKHITKSNQQTSSNDALTEQTSIIQQPNIKYPLENSWSFWFYKNEKSKEWKDNLVFITTVDFVEDFWAFV
jgi:hypothetical protein